MGNEPLGIDCDVLPRLAERTLAVQVRPGPAPLEAETQAALAALEEPVVTDDAAAVAHLAAGCLPAADWSRRVLDAHDDAGSDHRPVLAQLSVRGMVKDSS